MARTHCRLEGQSADRNTVLQRKRNQREHFSCVAKVIANRDQEARIENAKLLQSRRQRLRQQGKEMQPVFAPVKLVDQARSEIVAREIKIEESRGGCIEVLTPGGYTVRLPLALDLPTIAMILRAIEGAGKSC